MAQHKMCKLSWVKESDLVAERFLLPWRKLPPCLHGDVIPLQQLVLMIERPLFCLSFSAHNYSSVWAALHNYNSGEASAD